MEKSITMRRKRKGIEIVVVIRENYYDLYIDITPQADLSKKIIEKDYKMKLIFHDGRKSTTEPMHLEFVNKKYRDNEISNNSKIKMKNEDYRFEISLSPSLYVFPKKLDEAMEKQKNKKKPKKRISLKGIRMPGLATSKITKYTHSNINRPYSGGSCTPK